MRRSGGVGVRPVGPSMHTYIGLAEFSFVWGLGWGWLTLYPLFPRFFFLFWAGWSGDG